ncbi:hypothetical protein L9H26_08240 [Morganella psychrotolerans]|uniref:hypothetical protein n=1 Tax=Morganella psychrotolerans TaxID=368603 RepID=UPI000B08EC73|nr:hypothetical protein [Morganella psychrotolerans]
MTKSRLYDDSMIEILRDDPEFSTAYLYQAFLDIDEDGGLGAFWIALCHIIEAHNHTSQ